MKLASSYCKKGDQSYIFTSHYVQMTSWVATEILQRRTPSQRAVVIEHFIQIANFCYKHNDLHCALNITIALGSACIKSLRLTWNEVDKKVSRRRRPLTTHYTEICLFSA